MEKLLTVIGILADGKPMQPEWRDHPLGGNFKGKRDCHIEPDWILIYAIEDDELSEIVEEASLLLADRLLEDRG